MTSAVAVSEKDDEVLPLTLTDVDATGEKTVDGEEEEL